MQSHPSQRVQHPAISVRFGDAVLEAGHTAIPNLALNHYAELGLTPAEMLFAIHVWQHWWTERNPYPSLGTVAARMGVSRRQVRSYVHNLKAKGYLVVNDRQAEGLGQVTNEYDFAPFIQAIVSCEEKQTHPGNDPSGGSPGKPSSVGPGKRTSSEENEVQEDPAQASKRTREREDSSFEVVTSADRRLGPNGIRAEITPRGVVAIRELLRRIDGGAEPSPAPRVARTSLPPSRTSRPKAASSRSVTYPYLDSVIEAVTERLGDETHLASNLIQAHNLLAASQLPEADFVAAVFRAESLVNDRRRGCKTALRRRGAYFFSVLRNLLTQGVPSPIQVTTAPAAQNRPKSTMPATKAV